MSFGQHLRALREGAGLSRSALARKAGIPVSTLRNWEGNRSRVEGDNVPSETEQ